MLTVIIESPYAADTAAGVARNLRYLRACIAYCLSQDAAPYASHGLYTQPGVLNDKVPEERKKGMRAGFSIAKKLDERWMFIDLGITDGMLRGEESAKKYGQPVRRLSIPDWEKNARHEALIDQVLAGIIFHFTSDLELEIFAPAREVLASWSDEELISVREYIRRFKSDRLPSQGPAVDLPPLPKPICLKQWLDTVYA